MLALRARVVALVVFTAFGCGDDEASPDDDGAPPDASPVADTGDGSDTPDASDDLCPGQLTSEALVADAGSGAAVFDVAVAEAGADNQTTSAPNGRAVLCLPAGAPSEVEATLADYLVRRDAVDPDAAAASVGTAQPYPIDMLSAAAADELLTALGPGRDEAASLVLVSVVSYPDGEPLVGAEIAIDEASDGAFARDLAGEFTASAEAAVADGRLVLFANVVDGDTDGEAAITVTPPGDFAGSCVGPPRVELEAGGLSGAFFACQ